MVIARPPQKFSSKFHDPDKREGVSAAVHPKINKGKWLLKWHVTQKWKFSFPLNFFFFETKYLKIWEWSSLVFGCSRFSPSSAKKKSESLGWTQLGSENTREKLTFKCKKENCLYGPTFQNRQIKTPDFGCGGFWTCCFRKFMTLRNWNLICTCAVFLDFPAKSSFTPLSRHFWSHVPNTCLRNSKI